MATVQDCEAALERLAARLAAKNADGSPPRGTGFDRTLTCTLPDLAVTFGGRLRDHGLENIRQVDGDAAQIRLTMSSDDLVELVDGRLNLANSWASGRVKVEAGVLDLLRLRSIF